ncbi:hypothetical protein ACFFJY_03040 [Fictibacillus aquaticus]|nr:hypothetical protein [Fictibacillus aquaticus]
MDGLKTPLNGISMQDAFEKIKKEEQQSINKLEKKPSSLSKRLKPKQ